MSRDNPFAGGGFDKDDDLVSGNGAAAWGSAPRGSGGGGGGNAWGGDLGVPPVIGVADADSALSSARAALDARERDLAAREAALARAEEDVRRRASRANAGGAAEASGRPEKNWPPCCSILHHDIEGEVPADARGAVTSAYRAYLGLVFCLVYNCAAAFARLAANKMDPTKLPAFLMAAIYLTAGVPGAWVLWYARLYNAAIKDRALTYGVFFLAFSCHVVFVFWSALAPPFASGASHSGFIEGVAALSKSAFVGGVYLAGGVLWSLEGLWSLYVIKAAYACFRGKGADRRLKAELAAAGAGAAAAAAGAAATHGGGRV